MATTTDGTEGVRLDRVNQAHLRGVLDRLGVECRQGGSEAALRAFGGWQLSAVRAAGAAHNASLEGSCDTCGLVTVPGVLVIHGLDPEQCPACGDGPTAESIVAEGAELEQPAPSDALLAAVERCADAAERTAAASEASAAFLGRLVAVLAPAPRAPVAAPSEQAGAEQRPARKRAQRGA